MTMESLRNCSVGTIVAMHLTYGMALMCGGTTAMTATHYADYRAGYRGTIVSLSHPLDRPGS